MTDAFDAIATANHRKLIDVLAAHPGLTEEELVSKSKLGAVEVKLALKKLHKAGVVTARGAGKNTKFSVSIAALGKVATWVNKHVPKPKSKLEKKVDDQIDVVADRLGEWVANGSSWLQSKLAENTNIKSSDDLAREIGRLLADAKKQADDTVGDSVRDTLNEVKKRVKRK